MNTTYRKVQPIGMCRRLPEIGEKGRAFWSERTRRSGENDSWVLEWTDIIRHVF